MFGFQFFPQKIEINIIYYLHLIYIIIIHIHNMEIYTYLSKLYGLIDMITKTGVAINSDGSEIKEIIISIDDVTNEIKETIVKHPKKFYEKKVPRFIINNLYRLFILIILFCECLHPIISAAINKNIQFFTASFFSYMFLTQFIFGVLLYKNDYYKVILDKIHFNNYNMYVNTAYICGFIIALILAVVPIFTTGYIINIYDLSNYNIYARIFLTVYIVTNRLYSYNIFFANGIIFALLMYLHCCEIKNYKKSLESMVDENIMDLNISSTIKEYTDIKGMYADSVINTNNMCASIIIFGLLGCYFTLINIKNENNDIYSYIDAVCSLLIQIIYIMSISIITNTVNDIKSLIDSPKFVAIFLNRSSFATVNGDTYNNYSKDNLTEMTPLMKEKTLQNLNITDNKSTPLNPLATSIPNIIKPSSSGLKTSNSHLLRQNSVSKLNSIQNNKFINNRIIVDTVEQMNNSDDINKKIDFIKTITFRELIISTENAINLDWIILYSKLSDPWERFVVCGFEINDSQIFQQIVAMATGALGVLEISKIIG